MFDRSLMQLKHDNEQDRAAATEWWEATSVEDKKLVWDRIQRPYRDLVAEIICRFAQLAFGEMAEREAENKK